jgi:hypothetical protein
MKERERGWTFTVESYDWDADRSRDQIRIVTTTLRAFNFSSATGTHRARKSSKVRRGDVKRGG